MLSFAHVGVLWSYWSCKPAGWRGAEGMSKKRL